MSQSQHHLKCLENQMSFYLEALDLDQLAQQTSLIQRCSNHLSALDWLRFFSIDLLDTPKASHEELCRRFMFFEQLFHHCLKIARQQVLQQFSAECLSNFNHFWLQDITQCRLHPSLSPSFKGTGGSASPASLKIDLLEDLKSQCIESVEITAGKQFDQSFHPRLLERLSPDDLVLRDLGYFALDAFLKIDHQEAYFLTRLFKSVDLYLEDDESAPPLELAHYLNKYFPSQN